MQLSRSVSIPDALELARVRGELLVFAGAGVSMGPPADMPSFVDLAREIGEAKQRLDLKDEPSLDRYLGRLERKGVLVQARARERLAARKGPHNALHEHLLGIFGDADRVRLITTNFDRHFTSAARRVFVDSAIPHYSGPALPPGSTFAGIVQIHGSLDAPQDRLVLTDRDFAAAYMAEGWAARFLVEAFRDQTILFVGYSLADPLLQYLMRATPAGKRAYALCPQDECSHWGTLDVTPIPFSTGSRGDRYEELHEALKRWDWYSRASETDHDRELRAIIDAGPPASPLDSDYVRARLATHAGRVTFCHAAVSTEWFAWVVAQGFLDPLLNSGDSASPTGDWIHWCLQHFASGDQPPLLDFIRRRKFDLHPDFLFRLIVFLGRDTLPPRPVVHQLTAVVVSTRPPRVTHCEWLFRRLVEEGYRDEAVEVLRWLTALHLEPIEELYLSLESGSPPERLPALTNRLGMRAVASDLAQELEDNEEAVAALLSEELVALGIERLSEAYRLLRLARGTAGGTLDWLSFGRTAIARSNQDVFSDAIDVLVIAVRTALDYWKEKAPAQLLAFGTQHSRDARSLVRRLALYAFSLVTDLDRDSLLGRAIDESWAADFHVRPEFYAALKEHYPGASDEAKRAFLECLSDDASWAPFDEHQAHARFGLSQMLLRIDPDDSATQSFARAQRKAHPEWAEGDPDGLLSRVESGTGGAQPSPISADKMLQWSARDTIEHVSHAITAAAGRGEAESILGAVQQATERQPLWGIRLLPEDASRDSPIQGLAAAIIWTLRASVPEHDHQLAFLALLAKWEWPPDLLSPISSTLDAWSRNLAVEGDDPLLAALDAVADRVYDRARVAGAEQIDQLGWTEGAMNHPAGHAATVWWMVANARNRVGDKFVLSISDAERQRWERVLNDDSPAGTYARVILGMASDRLSAGDAPWSERMLFPSFDPTRGPTRAAQLWDGRLMQRRYSWSTLDGLRPYLGPFLDQSAKLTPNRSRELGDFMAMLVSSPNESQLGLKELQRFVAGGTPESRHAFARAVPRHLTKLTPAARAHVWHDILQPYWDDRRTNVPIALEPDEIAAMIHWVPAFPDLAPEVVGELLKTPGERMPHADGIVYEWRNDRTWVQAHPNEAAAMIRWLAERRSIEDWTLEDAASELETALGAGAAPKEILEAADALAALGCPQAIDLANRLRDEDEGSD